MPGKGGQPSISSFFTKKAKKNSSPKKTASPKKTKASPKKAKASPKASARAEEKKKKKKRVVSSDDEGEVVKTTESISGKRVRVAEPSDLKPSKRQRREGTPPTSAGDAELNATETPKRDGDDMVSNAVAVDVTSFEPSPSARQKFEKNLRRIDEQKTESKSLLVGGKYTPLELQVVEHTKKNPGITLCFEVGYKWRFFGDQAEEAAAVLGFRCWPDKHFMTFSIPQPTLYRHVKTLVRAGLKVGLVTQTESAAVKNHAKEGSKGPFERALTEVYTTSTMIGDLDPFLADEEKETKKKADEEDGDDASKAQRRRTQTVLRNQAGTAVPLSTYLVCFWERCVSTPDLNPSESGPGAPEKVLVSMAAVQPSTGDVLYDEFEDGFLRVNTETRLACILPSEILIPTALSKQSEKLVHVITGMRMNAKEGIRIERRRSKEFAADTARNILADFFLGDENKAGFYKRVMALPRGVVQCLGVITTYLQEFGLADVFGANGTVSHFRSRQQMSLNAATMRNLEILENEASNKVEGSLLWLMDHATTPFGCRLLKKWIAHPLIDPSEINDRLDAVMELRNPASIGSKKLEKALKTLTTTDLERGICRIYYGKVSAKDFVHLMRAIQRAAKLLPPLANVREEFSARLVRETFEGLPDVASVIAGFLDVLDLRAIEAGEHIFKAGRVDDVDAKNQAVQEVQARLAEFLKVARGMVNISSLQYKTVMKIAYLIEIPKGKKIAVPDDWVKVNSVKNADRYHPPEVSELLKELAYHEECLRVAVDAAWSDFLRNVSECYAQLREVIAGLGTLDCLMALAKVSKLPNYCRPVIVDHEGTKPQELVITGGRHPVVEQLDVGTYVPNDIHLRGDGERCMIITGPNMGGKSSLIRSTALIIVMAQIGSCVPASSCRLTPFDAVFTRMGAQDDIAKGHSTFYVELLEASDVLHMATDRSLVILDELGRGTSTHDGVAIAFATLEACVKDIKCFTLFVTHYPSIASLQRTYPNTIGLFHMAFMEEEPGDGVQRLVFLYQLEKNVVETSYGLNVAQLAGIPNDILRVAAAKSAELEQRLSIESVAVNMDGGDILSDVDIENFRGVYAATSG